MLSIVLRIPVQEGGFISVLVDDLHDVIKMEEGLQQLKRL